MNTTAAKSPLPIAVSKVRWSCGDDSVRSCRNFHRSTALGWPAQAHKDSVSQARAFHVLAEA